MKTSCSVFRYFVTLIYYFKEWSLWAGLELLGIKGNSENMFCLKINGSKIQKSKVTLWCSPKCIDCFFLLMRTAHAIFVFVGLRICVCSHIFKCVRVNGETSGFGFRRLWCEVESYIALGSLLNSLYRKCYSLKISMKELYGKGQTEVIRLSFHKIILWGFFCLDLKFFLKL